MEENGLSTLFTRQDLKCIFQGWPTTDRNDMTTLFYSGVDDLKWKAQSQKESKKSQRMLKLKLIHQMVLKMEREMKNLCTIVPKKSQDVSTFDITRARKWLGKKGCHCAGQLKEDMIQHLLRIGLEDNDVVIEVRCGIAQTSALLLQKRSVHVFAFDQNEDSVANDEFKTI